MKSVHWHLPVLSITNPGFRPSGSVSALKQMQQYYSESNPWRSLKYVYKKEVEKHCKTRCQLPRVLQVGKSSTIMHCCTHGQLSEDRGISDMSFVCFIMQCRGCEAHKWLPPARCHDMQWNILWGLHKEVDFYKNLVCFFFLMHVWLHVLMGFHKYIKHRRLPCKAAGIFHLLLCVTWWKGTKRKKAVQLSNKKFTPCQEQFLPCRRISDSHSCAVAGALQPYLFFFIWLWSEIYCEHEHRVTTRTTAASDLNPVLDGAEKMRPACSDLMLTLGW